MKKTITIACFVLTLGVLNISFASNNLEKCKELTASSNCCQESAAIFNELQAESDKLISEMTPVDLTASVLDHFNCPSDCCLETTTLLNDLQLESRELLNEIPSVDLTASVLIQFLPRPWIRIKRKARSNAEVYVQYPVKGWSGSRINNPNGL